MTLKGEKFYPKVECELFKGICQDFYHMTQFNPKGTILVTTSKERDVMVWDIERGIIKHHLENINNHHKIIKRSSKK